MVAYSPLALAQLDNLWDYGFHRFGLKQADDYLDGLFDAVEDIEEFWAYRGLKPRLLPNDLISDITSEVIHFFRYEHELIYFKKMQADGIGVVSILGLRMDTPNRLREMLLNPLSAI